MSVGFSLFNKNGSIFISISNDSRVKIFSTDANNNNSVQQFTDNNHLTQIYTAAAICNNKNNLALLALGTSIGDIIIIDLSLNTIKQRIIGAHSSIINDIKFNNNNTILYTCSNDHTVKSWNINNNNINY